MKTKGYMTTVIGYARGRRTLVLITLLSTVDLTNKNAYNKTRLEILYSKSKYDESQMM
jgi:hypothetical protein